MYTNSKYSIYLVYGHSITSLSIVLADEYHHHSLSLENLNYDLCEGCYQSIDDDQKPLFLPSKTNPWTQYAKVQIYISTGKLYKCMDFICLYYSVYTYIHVQVMKSKTVCEMLVRAAEEFAGLPCLGYRQVNNGTPEKSFKWLVQCMHVRCMCITM